ncbi:hypothetical protein GBAR_LOCUS23587 [Geodia barretti]|uniref:Uncharacterized protein n=1 Tax=Geodia barretti TaxID=519541 RepID=A0AA35T667_GEOBA|nr:hypothetical protein GBAR_LOCUS23587 [Geodia barretti]
MRITLQLLWKRAQEPLEEVELLNLSGNKISMRDTSLPNVSLLSVRLCMSCEGGIEELEHCPSLQSLVLSNNSISVLHNLTSCHQLWSLDLTGNRIENMLWMLYPISGYWTIELSQWRKASERVFVPTFMKQLLVNGVFGKKTTHLMAQFPASYTHNTEMDRRRLHYLAHTLEEEIKLHMKYSSKEMEGEGRVPELCRMIETRNSSTEQSTTMLLILILAHLEYGLPHDILRETLETAKLTKIGEVWCADVFGLPRDMMLGVATLLLGAAAVDRQDKKVCSGTSE